MRLLCFAVLSLLLAALPAAQAVTKPSETAVLLRLKEAVVASENWGWKAALAVSRAPAGARPAAAASAAAAASEAPQ